jgi:HPt (histidine-containing phosphotransfer) domain-containing protein
VNSDSGETALLESFAQEARRRCDVISAGLETGTNDYETLRSEAHALKGTSSVVGLQRLSELAGLKALADGAAAAAEGKEEPPDVGRSLAQLFSA